MTVSQLILPPLGLKTEFHCDIKMAKFGIYFSKKKRKISESYTILKYFLCILSFLTCCKLENLGIQWYAIAFFVLHFPMHHKHVCNTLKIYLLTPQEFKPR